MSRHELHVMYQARFILTLQNLAGDCHLRLCVLGFNSSVKAHVGQQIQESLTKVGDFHHVTFIVLITRFMVAVLGMNMIWLSYLNIIVSNEFSYVS